MLTTGGQKSQPNEAIIQKVAQSVPASPSQSSSVLRGSVEKMTSDVSFFVGTGVSCTSFVLKAKSHFVAAHFSSKKRNTNEGNSEPLKTIW